ncbi:Borealin N terminal-domain-containing protein [Pestalotiopsis sp. NC0098]|nr:Borealin N terminal-domain-containing protein [Pestalotiopsis sp. NC0098]
MAPPLTRKRKSDQSPASTDDGMPMKKRKMDLTVAQKQALIDNLQLEITERARRLRAQYNIQSQQLRSRVEMRVNRIPTALRKLKMGDLMAKHSGSQKTRARSPYVAKPPPVPLKDGASPKPIPRKPVSGSTQRAKKRLSETVSRAEDKENSVEPTVVPKKKGRGTPAAAAAAEASRNLTGQILSPASTNARVLPRAAERPTSPAKSQLYSSSSPAKSMIARPASPSKALGTKSSSNLISNMVQKAKSTRGAAAGTQKATTSSSTTGTASRSKKAAPATGSTRGRRKISQSSESSEASTGTVVKKTTAASRGGTAATKQPPAVKRSVMNTIKSATAKKAAPSAKSTTGTSTTGRTLRKRQAA